MRRISTVVIVLTAFAASCKKSGEGGSEGEAITRTVQDSLRAGYTKGDFNAFMSIWADDAKFTYGRSEMSDEFDYEQTRGQFAARRRLTFQEPAVEGAKLEFTNVSCAVTDETATLGFTADFSFPGFRQVYEDRYWLRKSQGAWKIERCRFWPVELEFNGKRTRFDAEYWRSSDAAVENARSQHVSVLIGALFDAHRYREALEPARQWTQREPKSASAWLMRGSAEMQIGEVDNAVQSWHKSFELDPQSPVPSYAKKQR